ncbi:DNA-binding transcriptional regulator (plasmid) [Vibrio nigripulchritudo]|uniref:sugar-binding transcriptional regulator n=1 Tax=Vibrio nigripulchritudo TaxID=28173 RepID=UPI00190DF180|nr:sugar-binding domain-containing protein [Vibrio nigripulchritudo]BCL73653.1 DNA-binding transcriptional regulator [Vibrio nigripulchritudo]BDU35022.1 DNA-binding transcriptional regulator [Vibrio nigripulchritudo]
MDRDNQTKIYKKGGKPLSIERAQFLSGIAEAYYNEGLNQNEIASRFGVTRSAISRHLSEAKESGIVTIHVKPLFDKDLDLEERLSAVHPNTNVYVLNTPVIGSDARAMLLSRYAAYLIYEQLKDDMSVTLTFGTMVDKVVDQLASRAAKKISIVQMCGSTGVGGEDLDAHTIVAKLSKAYGSPHVYLPAPFMVESDSVRQSLQSNPAVVSCCKHAKESDIAIVGMGSLDAEQSSLVLGNHMEPERFNDLRRAGACGDLGGYMLNSEGLEVNCEQYHPIMAMPFKDFLKVPKRFGVCDGVHKKEVVKIALQHGLVTDLVLTSRLATTVAEML